MNVETLLYGLCVGLGFWAAKLVLDAIQAGIKKLVG
jgi:hypothetical protein